jgi:DNA-binding NarL/FixJ family response regulator
LKANLVCHFTEGDAALPQEMRVIRTVNWLSATGSSKKESASRAVVDEPMPLRPGRISIILGDGSHLNAELIAKEFKERKSNIDVLHSATDATSLLALLSNVEPDIVVTQARLRDGNNAGYRVIRQLRKARPKTRVIVLLNSTDRREVIDAFRNGAHGVLTGDDSFEILSKCIEAVMRGEVWASRRELSYVLEAFSEPAPFRLSSMKQSNRLTKREEQIVQLVGEALTNREISEQLMLSENTVRNYLFRIFDKTGVSSRMELVLRNLHRAE